LGSDNNRPKYWRYRYPPQPWCSTERHTCGYLSADWSLRRWPMPRPNSRPIFTSIERGSLSLARAQTTTNNKQQTTLSLARAHGHTHGDDDDTPGGGGGGGRSHPGPLLPRGNAAANAASSHRVSSSAGVRERGWSITAGCTCVRFVVGQARHSAHTKSQWVEPVRCATVVQRGEGIENTLLDS